LEPGDVIVAYLKRYGFVGIGIVKEKAVKVDDFRFKRKSVRELKLVEPFIIDNCDNCKSEYLVRVEWQRTVDRQEAKWSKNGGLFTSQLIKASLQGQPKTIEFLEKMFDIRFLDLKTD
jgi:hypothetical protein